MSYVLQRILQSRFRISGQLYAAIGGAVLLTIAASLVGLYSFERVGNVQSGINEGTVPGLAAAFGVARYSGELVAAGPRLTAAATSEDSAAVVASINKSHQAFEQEMSNLAQHETDDGRLPLVRARADALITNIGAMTDDKSRTFELARWSEEMRLELDDLRFSLDRIVVSGLDDQFFYTVLGYRELGEAPAKRSEHFTGEELDRYRHLVELQVDGNIATDMLVSAFNVSGAAAIHSLRERFISAQGRIERNLIALQNSEIHGEIAPTYQRLFDLGLAKDSGFDVLEQQLRLSQRQGDLLALNRDIEIGLVVEVDNLVAAAETSAAEATRSSAQAFFTGRALLLGISVFAVIGATLIAWLFIGRVLLRRLQMLSAQMRRMAAGDLEAPVEIRGQDEISEMGVALEGFRRSALEERRLNLVEQMAEELQDKNDELETVLADLQRAQDQIVMQQKLAALGELTAGVAHEIRNPLNFVKNFSEGSDELLVELRETLDENADRLEEDQQALIRDISSELSENMERIRNHGERANRIVQDMLMMGRGGGGQEPTDINRLLDQNTRLAYHSARATNPDFQLDWQEDLDQELGEIEVVPQDLGRVFLNMIGNACDATAEKRAAVGPGDAYSPTLWLTTRRGDEQVEIRIRDNGNGIPEDVIDKIFNPFFTTKPTDRGTGLGLAISNDIVRQHGGSIRAESEPGEFTEMIIQIPLSPPARAVGTNGDGQEEMVGEVS